MLPREHSGEQAAEGWSESVGVRKDVEMMLAEHPGEVRSRLLLDGEGVGVETMAFAGLDGLADVVDAVVAFVAVVVTGAPIRQQDDEAA